MSLDIEKTIREYLPGIVHMSLATTAGGKPWVCEVHFAYDDNLNLYFRSKPSRRHSQEIANNPNVAGNIVMQHKLEDKPRGIYFEGKAEALRGVDKDHIAYTSMHERIGFGPEVLEEPNLDDGHGFYKITVSDYYVFDARESTPSAKYHLSWHSKS